eukprot:365927-Chlamydomonas_euryale.AAC.2
MGCADGVCCRNASAATLVLPDCLRVVRQAGCAAGLLRGGPADGVCCRRPVLSRPMGWMAPFGSTAQLAAHAVFRHTSCLRGLAHGTGRRPAYARRVRTAGRGGAGRGRSCLRGGAGPVLPAGPCTRLAHVDGFISTSRQLVAPSANLGFLATTLPLPLLIRAHRERRPEFLTRSCRPADLDGAAERTVKLRTTHHATVNVPTNFLPLRRRRRRQRQPASPERLDVRGGGRGGHARGRSALHAERRGHRHGDHGVDVGQEPHHLQRLLRKGADPE